MTLTGSVLLLDFLIFIFHSWEILYNGVTAHCKED
jgi:hypothetical protein